jgi:2-dehydro-3-deoxyphosphogalactonate aldolase
MNWNEVLGTLPLVAILRGLRPEEAVAIGTVLYEAGFRCLEVPLNSPEPLASIGKLRQAFGDRLLVGAGTVLDAGSVDAVAQAGGQLIISPNTDTGVIRAAKAAGLVSLPGFFTPSEAFQAIAAGADALKLFPAEGASPAVLKGLKAVLPKAMPVLPVGGIAPDNMAAFRRAGAGGFGIGSALFKPGMTPQQVAQQAAAFVNAWQAAPEAG